MLNTYKKIDIYLHFISFLYIEKAQVVEILPYEKTLLYTMNTVAADGLVTQGVRASAAMLLA